MLLAIDAGNTNTVIGVFDNEKLVKSWRISTDRHKMADEYGLMISHFLSRIGVDEKDIVGIIMASVVPSVLTQMKEMAIREFNVEAVVVNTDLDIGFSTLYENPKELGADRIANAIGGYAEYGGPLIIADFGTATTFDVISENGVYLGGAIAPGVGISMEALAGRTAMLPKIDLTISPEAIGTNTISSMHSGIYFGFLGQMEEIIRRIKSELKGNPKVVSTGGLGEIIAGNSKLVDVVDPDLTLKGLMIIFHKVRNRLEVKA